MTEPPSPQMNAPRAATAATHRSTRRLPPGPVGPGLTAMILDTALPVGTGCSGPSEPPSDPETFGAGQVLIDALGGAIKRTLTPIDPFGHGRIERNYRFAPDGKTDHNDRGQPPREHSPPSAGAAGCKQADYRRPPAARLSRYSSPTIP